MQHDARRKRMQIHLKVLCRREVTDGAVAAEPIARIILRLAIQYSPAGTPHCLEETIVATVATVPLACNTVQLGPHIV